MTLVSKSFSEIVTFSRSSNATRVGPTGLVEYAPHNLLQRSQEFDNAYWTKGEASATANAIAAPDGTVTADSIIENTNPAQHEARVGFTFTGSTVYTLSVYAKTNGRNLLVYLDGFAGGRNFDLSNGTVGSVVGTAPSAATITSVGNGWYRCTITFTWGVGSTANVRFLLLNGTNNSYTGNGTSGVYLWGAQLSVGPYALDYTPTTSAAVYGPRFDYDGSGVTIVEPVSRNLQTYSEQFDNAAWTKSGASINANATAAPDGTVTAEKLVEDSSNGGHQTYQIGLTVVAQSYTASVYAKAAERTNIWLALFNGTNNGGVYFNLANGTAGSLGTDITAASITSVGNGWYRCSITRTMVASANAGINIQLADSMPSISYVGNGSSGVFIWGAQLEVGSTATGYMASGATNGFRAVPVVSGSATARGLLVEEQRTNLLTYSEDYSNAAWTKAGVSITANAVASPDGTVNADLVTPSTTGSALGCYQAVVGNVSGTKYTLSVFAKASGKNFLMLGTDNSASYIGWFNISSGTVGTMSSGYSGTITNYGNGWYRCVLTWDGSVGRNFPFVGLSDADGSVSVTLSGSNGILVWGAQFESSASFATSYIPTLASTVTRSADVASVNTLSPWFNATEGTLYTESVTNDNGTSPASFVNTGSSDIIGLGYSGTNTSRLYILTSGVAQANLSVSYTGSVVREAAAYKVNDAQSSANGTLSSQDTSVTLPSINKLNIGYFPTAVTYQNGWIRRLAYFPRRLSSAELQALTV